MSARRSRRRRDASRLRLLRRKRGVRARVDRRRDSPGSDRIPTRSTRWATRFARAKRWSPPAFRSFPAAPRRSPTPPPRATRRGEVRLAARAQSVGRRRRQGAEGRAHGRRVASAFSTAQREARPTSATRRSTSSAISKTPNTSSCKSSPTSTATCCTSANATARCSGGTRSCGRRPRRTFRRACAHGLREAGIAGGAGDRLRLASARSSASSPATSSTSSR